MSELIFRDSDHTYWLDGQEIPSVSAVLQDMGFSGNPFYTPEGAARGKAVHLATARLDEGVSIDDMVFLREGQPDSIAEYVRDYAAFREKHPKFQWFQIEEVSANERLRYGATRDRLGVDEEGLPCVLDIKTGQQAGWHKVQLAAYDFDGDLHRYALYLTKTPGKFKLIQFRDNTDYTAWDYAVWLWWYQRGNL